MIFMYVFGCAPGGGGRGKGDGGKGGAPVPKDWDGDPNSLTREQFETWKANNPEAWKNYRNEMAKQFDSKEADFWGPYQAKKAYERSIKRESRAAERAHWAALDQQVGGILAGVAFSAAAIAAFFYWMLSKRSGSKLMWPDEPVALSTKQQKLLPGGIARPGVIPPITGWEKTDTWGILQGKHAYEGWTWNETTQILTGPDGKSYDGNGKPIDPDDWWW